MNFTVEELLLRLKICRRHWDQEVLENLDPVEEKYTGNDFSAVEAFTEFSTRLWLLWGRHPDELREIVHERGYGLHETLEYLLEESIKQEVKGK